MATYPRLLGPGSHLAVWAPSSPAPAVFPNRFARGVEALAAEGYRVSVMESCRSAEGPSTLPPEAVAAELHGALADPSVDGVVAAVGGWTMLTVLPHLDYDAIGRAGKPIIGYSDITSLLSVLPARSGLIGFHGPMVVSEWGEQGGAWAYTRRGWHAVLDAERSAGPTVVPEADEWSDELLWWDREDVRPRQPTTGGERLRILSSGSAEGQLWGGSLLSLSLLLGTPYWHQPDGAILFLEAEAIAPDELLARLTQLRLAGAFERSAGVLFGKIGRPGRTASGYDDFDAIVRAAMPAGIPVAAGFDVGHSEPMATLPVGGRARLECAGAGPELTLLP